MKAGGVSHERRMTIHEVPAPAPPAAQREAPPISLLTVALLDLLRGIGRGPGLIHITAQKRAALTFQPPFSLVPRPLLE